MKPARAPRGLNLIPGRSFQRHLARVHVGEVRGTARQPSHIRHGGQRERGLAAEVVSRLSVQAPVEPAQLLLLAYAQADEEVYDLQDDERGGAREADREADADELVEQLRAVAVEQPHGERAARGVLEDGVDGA